MFIVHYDGTQWQTVPLDDDGASWTGGLYRTNPVDDDDLVPYISVLLAVRDSKTKAALALQYQRHLDAQT